MKGPSAIKSLLQKLPLFLLTIPLVFFIHMENYYFGLLHWKYIITDILVCIAVPFVIYFTLGKLWRSMTRAGVLLCALLIIFYFFHLLYDGLSDSPLSFLAQYTILLPLIFGGLLVLIIYLHRRKKTFHSFYYFSNLAFLLLLAGGLVQFIFLTINKPAARHDQADPSKTLAKSYQPCDTCTMPDIYFILLDGYTNSKTLQQEFDYDNSAIESKLKQLGFVIPSRSRSNYNFTHMSLGSELNLNYLAHLDNSHRFYTIDFLQANYTISQNELCDILKKQGYAINNYSIFDLKDAPVKISPYLTELTWRSVLGQTFFNKLRRDIGWHLARFFPKDHLPAARKRKAETDLKRMQETFNGVVNVAKQRSGAPQFTYAHFLLPHETYYFDSTGKRLDLHYTAQTLVNKKDYINQLVYTNKFVLAPLIDSIFSHAKKPFTIVIQGDHGYRNYSAEKVMLEFENFSAVYFSDHQYGPAYDSLSSVNTFRLLLNKHFGQQLPLLKDSTINLYKKNSY